MNKPTRLFDFPRYQLATKPLDVMMTMPNYGNRVTYSTAQFVEEMDAVSRGLIALGMQAEDKVALISHNNRCEWNIMDHGIMQAGGIDVPIYPTMTEEDYKYILTHSESKYCFVSNEELYNKVMAVKAECPALEEVFTFEDVKGARHWSEVAKAGSDAQQAELDARRDAVDPAQLATIIYTSGTTGLPKGVMLSHNNVASNVLVAEPRVPAVDPNMDYRVLSFLPVCHIFERMLHYLYMYMGALRRKLGNHQGRPEPHPAHHVHGGAPLAREILRRHRGQGPFSRRRESRHLQLGGERGVGMGAQQRRTLPSEVEPGAQTGLRQGERGPGAQRH